MSMTEKQAEALRVFNECGNKRETARRLGINESAVRQRLESAKKWVEASEGHKAALETTGLNVDHAKFGWRIIQHDDGSRDSVFWDSRTDTETPVDDVVQALREAFSDLPAAPTIPTPSIDNEDTSNIVVYPVADLHIGLLTDAEEVGHDWDTKKALSVFEKTFAKLVSRTPASPVAIIGQLGDLTHNDDQRNITPQSGHQLDVDSRYFMIVRRAVLAMKWAIDTLRQKHPKVIYRGCRGNHDLTTHIAVTVALSEHYRDIPGVEIVESASEFYVHEHGANLFVFHHGDKAKPERLLPFIANEWAGEWGRTKHRVTFSGHVHHEWAKEMAGMLFRSIGTIIPRDVHAFSNAYGSNRCLMSFTYDHDDGEVATARVNL